MAQVEDRMLNGSHMDEDWVVLTDEETYELDWTTVGHRLVTESSFHQIMRMVNDLLHNIQNLHRRVMRIEHVIDQQMHGDGRTLWQINNWRTYLHEAYVSTVYRPNHRP